MTTAQAIINAAFSDIGVKPSEETLTAAVSADGLEILADILEEWNNTDILTGIDAPPTLATDLLEPRYATRALKSHVAGDLCGRYGIEISPSLAKRMRDSMSTLISTTFFSYETNYPSTLPRGSGNIDETDLRFFNEKPKPRF
jgi:hypothetical protein